MRLRLVTVAGLMGMILSVAPAQATSLTVESRLVQPNADFTLSIGIADVTDLVSFTFDVTFNPDVIALVGVQEGEFLTRTGGLTLPCTAGAGGGDTFPCTTEAGKVSVGNFLIGEGVSDLGLGGVLAVLSFRALAGGATPVELLMASLSNSQLDDNDPLASVIPIDAITAGLVTIEEPPAPTPVPEPSTLLLTAIGAALFAKRQRTKARAAR